MRRRSPEAGSAGNAPSGAVMELLGADVLWGTVMLQNVGNMILELREKKGITQNQLGRGLADTAEMSRLESGAKEKDSFLAEALFQRLGKSVEKFEMAISGAEYKMMLLRALIPENFSDGDYETVDVLLEEYERQPESGKPLHEQYRLAMKAMVVLLEDGDGEACARGLRVAVEVTCPYWQEENLAECMLCTQEIQILQLLFAQMLEMGEAAQAKRKLSELSAFLERRYTDAEERVKVYPQCAWILGKACCVHGDWEGAYEACRRGLACLAENGVLTVMDKLLEVQEVCLKRMGREEEACEAAKLKEAVSFLYKMTDSRTPEGDMLCLLLNGGKKELLINRELLKDMRISKGLTQERLSEGICSWETLSRIEEGKRKPNKKNLYRMYKKMGLDREKYYGYIHADRFALYEKVREMQKIWSKGSREAADDLAEEIAAELDMSVPVNKQFIETHRLISAVRKGKITETEAIGKAEELLRYTMKDYHGTVYRAPFREECVLLNQIALYMKHSGRMEEAIGLWEQILDRYQKSDVAEEHHAITEMLVYTNYPGALEVHGDLDKSEQAALKGMRLAMKCQTGDTAAIILANLACVYERRGTQKDLPICEKSLRYSFQLLRFYGHEVRCTVIKDYYEKIFGRN